MEEDIPQKVFESGKFGILLLQLEIPLSTVEYSASNAALNNIKVILNPAPARDLPDSLLRNIWLLIPNETEAEKLSGMKVLDFSSAETAAAEIQKKGVKNVIITMGEDGAFVKSENFTGKVPGVKVTAVDTTAAGDVFNGAIAVALSEGKELKDAVIFANKAASISVTRLGAQASAPYRHEIN
jgi:ribokinase